jgi:hypothetical protein
MSDIDFMILQPKAWLLSEQWGGRGRLLGCGPGKAGPPARRITVSYFSG